MVEHEIIWNGKSSSELGIHIISEPPYDIAEPSVTANHVMGRNGDILTEVYDFANSERSYQMAFELYEMPFTKRCSDVLGWLCGEYMTDGSHVYKELYDSYNPGIYYLASFKPSGEMQKTLGANASLGSYTASFNRRPERFLIEGKDLSAQQTIGTGSNTLSFVNPTKYASRPDIHITNIPANSKPCIHITHYGATRYSQYEYLIVINNTGTEYGSVWIDQYKNMYSTSEDVTYEILCQNATPFETLNMELYTEPTHWQPGDILFWPGPNTIHSVNNPIAGTSAVSGMSIRVAGHWWTL